MYSETEMQLMPDDLERHTIQAGSAEIVQAIGLLADRDVALVAVEGEELPRIAYAEGEV